MHLYAAPRCLLCLVVTLAAASARAADPEPLARPQRVAVSLGFGFGSVSLGRLHSLAEDVTTSLRNANPDLSLSGAPTSSLQINAQLGVRYYAPYHLLAEVGYGALYNWAASTYQVSIVSGEVKNDNVIMEVPLLVGGHYILIGRLYLFGGLGPSFFFFPRAFWDATHGGVPDFEADGGVGLHVLGGADFMLGSHASLGLDVRYRYLKTGALKDREYGVTMTSGMIRGDGSTATYDLDFSGVSLGLNLRLFVL